MAQRGQWSEHEARGVLSAWRKSEQSLERFAKERSLVPQRIRWWKAKLEARRPRWSARSRHSRCYRCKSRSQPSRSAARRSGHIVKVGRGFDEEAFARVVAVLEGT